MVERNMSSAVMGGTVVLPGSQTTSRAKGLRRKLGGPASGRRGANHEGPHREGGRVGKGALSRRAHAAEHIERMSRAACADSVGTLRFAHPTNYCLPMTSHGKWSQSGVPKKGWSLRRGGRP